MTTTERYGATSGEISKITIKSAFQKIKRKGWSTRWPRGSRGEYTILSAIKESLKPGESLIDYQSYFLDRLGYHVDHWEAKRGRTKREVLDLLKSI